MKDMSNMLMNTENWYFYTILLPLVFISWHFCLNNAYLMGKSKQMKEKHDFLEVLQTTLIK